jgi:hypothetical protein
VPVVFPNRIPVGTQRTGHPALWCKRICADHDRSQAWLKKRGSNGASEKDARASCGVPRPIPHEKSCELRSDQAGRVLLSGLSAALSQPRRTREWAQSVLDYSRNVSEQTTELDTVVDALLTSHKESVKGLVALK